MILEITEETPMLIFLFPSYYLCFHWVGSQGLNTYIGPKCILGFALKLVGERRGLEQNICDLSYGGDRYSYDLRLLS